jgi:hypothetical protein
MKEGQFSNLLRVGGSLLLLMGSISIFIWNGEGAKHWLALAAVMLGLMCLNISRRRNRPSGREEDLFPSIKMQIAGVVIVLLLLSSFVVLFLSGIFGFDNVILVYFCATMAVVFMGYLMLFFSR